MGILVPFWPRKAKLSTEAELKKVIRSLLNKVNKVTSSHRHGLQVRPIDLDALCDRQIEVEETLETLEAGL